MRTVNAKSAVPDKHYEEVDEIYTMGTQQKQQKIKIKIIDDEDCMPESYFMVELYNPETGLRLEGEDTQCTVTIVDKMKPGTIQFEKTKVQVSKSEEKVYLTLVRQEGTDGKISCNIRTEPCFQGDHLNSE